MQKLGYNTPLINLRDLKESEYKYSFHGLLKALILTGWKV